MLNPQPSERKSSEEANEDSLSPMDRFKALAKRLARVNRGEIEDVEQRPNNSGTENPRF